MPSTSNCPVNTTNQYTNGAILSKLAPAVLLKRHKFSFLFNELFNKVIRLRAEHCVLVLKKHRWWMARVGEEKGKGCLWCLYRGRICNHIYLSIDSIASMFVVFAARCHCVSPRMFPSYWSPSAASPAPGVSVSLLSPPLMKHRPPLETDVVTQSLVTAHRMHDISHSIKEDFNGSDLFYSLDNQFTFTLLSACSLLLQLSQIWKCN